MRRALPARHHYKETVSDRVTEGSNYGFIPADRRIAVETEGAITARPALALTSQVGCVCVCVCVGGVCISPSCSRSDFPSESHFSL